MAITIFKPDHTFIGKIVNKDDHNDAVKAVSGDWKIKDGKLYETIKASFIVFPIPNSVDQILCMNETMYKAKHLSDEKTIYTSTKLQ